VLAVHALSLEDQVIEGLFEERLDFGEAPVVTGNGSGGGAHECNPCNEWRLGGQARMRNG
jgi:hypothetical protein